MSGVGNLARSFGGGFSAPDPRSLRSPSYSPGYGRGYDPTQTPGFDQRVQESIAQAMSPTSSPSYGIEPGLVDMPAPPPPSDLFPPGFNDAVPYPGTEDPRIRQQQETYGRSPLLDYGYPDTLPAPQNQVPTSTPFLEQFYGLANAGLGNSQLFQVLNRMFEAGTMGQRFNPETGQFEQHPGVNPPSVGLQANPVETFMGLLESMSDQFNRSSLGGRQRSGFEFVPQAPVTNINIGQAQPFSRAGYGPGSNANVSRPPGALSGSAPGTQIGTFRGGAQVGQVGQMGVAGGGQPQQVYRGSYGPFEELMRADLFNQMLNREPATYGQMGQSSLVDPMAMFLAQQRGQTRSMPGTNTRSSGFRDVPLILERWSPYSGIGWRV